MQVIWTAFEFDENEEYLWLMQATHSIHLIDKLLIVTPEGCAHPWYHFA